MATEEARAVTPRGFSAYRLTFKMVTSFKYMGIVLLVAYDDWPTVVQNLVKARTV